MKERRQQAAVPRIGARLVCAAARRHRRSGRSGMEIFLFLVGRWLKKSKTVSDRGLLECYQGYFVQFAASCILLYKIWKHKSIYGLSIDTQVSRLNLWRATIFTAV